MILFDCLIYLSWVTQIFAGFTFTDWYDFIPLGLLLSGLGVIIWRANFRCAWADTVVLASLPLLATWALWPLITLWRLALEAQKMLGTWPQPMANDPKWMRGHTPGYDFWYSATTYTEAIAGAGLVIFGGLLMTEWKRFGIGSRSVVCGVAACSVFTFMIDPWALYAWWLD